VPLEDRDRWEERYRSGRHSPNEPPSEFLVAHADRISGRVLDVAAGTGRNALFLARRGASVEALDISFTGLCLARREAAAEGLTLLAAQVDLENFPLPQRRYDAIINIRYLQRSLFVAFRQALKPGGIILFETFLIDQQALSEHRAATYLLQRGELRAAFSGWDVLSYQEGCYQTSCGPSYLARMIARRPIPEPY
jgi:tellurite methyltransferase